MPRLCHETVFTKLDSMTYLNFLAEPGEIACEKIAGHLDFMGIWGEFDPEHIEERVPWTDLNWWRDFLLSLWAPEKVYFKLIVHTLIGLSCFLLGIFYRYNTIRNLRSEIDQNKNKNSQLMQQLWSALEEKLSIKAECENLKLEKEQTVRDLSLKEGENENLKSKAWGLERNVTILQSDRSQLEGKIRDLLNASLVTKNSFSTSQNESGIATQEELRACKSKMIQLQGLVKSLIEHTKQKDATLISAFQNSSQV